MSNNENQYYVYLRATKQKVYVSEEEFHNYYREIDSFRRKQQRHGKCVCQPSKRLECDMDCGTCPFKRSGDTISLDYSYSNDEGDEITYRDTLENGEPPIEDTIVEKENLMQVLSRLTELMPQAIEIGELRQQGYTEEAIAEKIGIGRKTYAYRLKKAYEVLKNEFSEIF